MGQNSGMYTLDTSCVKWKVKVGCQEVVQVPLTYSSPLLPSPVSPSLLLFGTAISNSGSIFSPTQCRQVTTKSRSPKGKNFQIFISSRQKGASYLSRVEWETVT